jgi:hypothetical protein
MSSSSDLALQHQYELASAQDRVDALMNITARETAIYIKPWAMPIISIVAGGLAGVSEGYFDGATGQIVNGIVTVAAITAGIMGYNNADLRNGAFSIAAGFGAAAAGVMAKEKTITWAMNRVNAAKGAGPAVPSAVPSAAPTGP